jgi:tRNA uridine 5-carbamoylmethylation protein Kti12
MKIKGWEKISGYTYKGYCIVNPIHDANEEVYYATILNLNHQQKPKWDITLVTNDTTGVITFRIRDNVSQHLMAKSHLTKPNIETLQKFREQYEMLVDDILEEVQLYVKKATTNINGGTTGIINQVQNAGTSVTYKSGSMSIPLTNIQANAIQALKDLQQQIDDYNKKL